jgi:hypothetical protein
MASLLSARMALLVKRRAREPTIGGLFWSEGSLGEVLGKELEEMEAIVVWRAWR